MLRPGAALLFDIDGTLADTDEFHLAAFNQVFAQKGHSFDRLRFTQELQGFSMAAIESKFLGDEPLEEQRDSMAGASSANARGENGDVRHVAKIEAWDTVIRSRRQVRAVHPRSLGIRDPIVARPSRGWMDRVRTSTGAVVRLSATRT